MGWLGEWEIPATGWIFTWSWARAPLIVAFHSSFNFGNIAGNGLYSMLMVTLSGFVGRYLYAHIPPG